MRGNLNNYYEFEDNVTSYASSVTSYAPTEGPSEIISDDVQSSDVIISTDVMSDCQDVLSDW